MLVMMLIDAMAVAAGDEDRRYPACNRRAAEQVHHGPAAAGAVNDQLAAPRKLRRGGQRDDVGHDVRVRRAQRPAPQVADHVFGGRVHAWICLLQDGQGGEILRLPQVQPDEEKRLH